MAVAVTVDFGRSTYMLLPSLYADVFANSILMVYCITEGLPRGGGEALS